MLRKGSFLIVGVISIAAVARAVADPPATPKLSTIVPAEDVAAQVRQYAQDLTDAVATLSFVPTPSVQETSTGSSYLRANSGLAKSSWNSPAKPPSSGKTRGVWVRCNSRGKRAIDSS